jgi:hypothetical protein
MSFIRLPPVAIGAAPPLLEKMQSPFAARHGREDAAQCRRQRDNMRACLALAGVLALHPRCWDFPAIILQLAPTRADRLIEAQARMQQNFVGLAMRRRQPRHGQHQRGKLFVGERMVAPHGRAEPASLADAFERVAIEAVATVIDRPIGNHLDEGEQRARLLGRGAGLAARTAQRLADLELDQRPVAAHAGDQFERRHDLVNGQLRDRARAEQRDENIAQRVGHLRRAALARPLGMQADDFAADVILDHGAERRRPRSLARPPFLRGMLGRIDTASDQLQPGPRLPARGFERQLAIGAERAAGRMLAARKAAQQ